MSLTEVWISREEMVDFLLYAASLEASVATRSKMSEHKVRRWKRRQWIQIGLTIDERVQDGHGTVGDTGVRVNLLEDWSDALVC